MKITLKKPIKEEKGQAMILVLILLVVGGLILAPLLGFMSTGLLAGQMHEERMAELYAADAGVEDALHKIMTNHSSVPVVVNGSWTYNIANVNGKTMDVTIYCIVKGVAGATYNIISVATDAGGSSNTTIDCYVVALPLFFTNAATSVNTVEVKSGVVVDGPIVENYPEDQWPFVQNLSDIYLNQIPGYPGAIPPEYDWTSGTLDVDVEENSTFGPLYRDGDLTAGGGEKGIVNTGIAGAVANIGSTTPEHENETVYVTGDLDIGVTSQDFTLNLNYNTIYCEGNIYIGGKTTITGSGCIIAQGDVDFKPNMLSGPDDFIFVMSEKGTVRFEPNGDFYGALAGNIEIELWPGNTLTLPDADDIQIEYLNFPLGSVESAVKILTWDISLQ